MKLTRQFPSTDQSSNLLRASSLAPQCKYYFTQALTTHSQASVFDTFIFYFQMQLKYLKISETCCCLLACQQCAKNNFIYCTMRPGSEAASGNYFSLCNDSSCSVSIIVNAIDKERTLIWYHDYNVAQFTEMTWQTERFNHSSSICWCHISLEPVYELKNNIVPPGKKWAEPTDSGL